MTAREDLWNQEEKTYDKKRRLMTLRGEDVETYVTKISRLMAPKGGDVWHREEETYINKRRKIRGGGF